MAATQTVSQTTPAGQLPPSLKTKPSAPLKTRKGLIIPFQQVGLSEGLKVRSGVAYRAKKTKSFPGLEKRYVFYVYVEFPKTGEGPRTFQRIDKAVSRYKTTDSTEETKTRAARARDKALEAAAELACGTMYKLRHEKTRFTCVFVSEHSAIEQARKDPALYYYWRG